MIPDTELYLQQNHYMWTSKLVPIAQLAHQGRKEKEKKKKKEGLTRGESTGTPWN